MSKGAYRVGANFNPSDSAAVDRIKGLAALLIDEIDDLRLPPGNEAEVGRLKSLATTAAEEAAMWGVKAATKPNPDHPG